MGKRMGKELKKKKKRNSKEKKERNKNLWKRFRLFSLPTGCALSAGKDIIFVTHLAGKDIIFVTHCCVRHLFTYIEVCFYLVETTTCCHFLELGEFNANLLCLTFLIFLYSGLYYFFLYCCLIFSFLFLILVILLVLERECCSALWSTSSWQNVAHY